MYLLENDKNTFVEGGMNLIYIFWKKSFPNNKFRFY